MAARLMECQESAGEYRRAMFPSLLAAETRVLGIQTKLHQWARQDPGRRFDRAWRRARLSLGLPHLRLHDLRHTGNTPAAATGASTRG